MERNTKHSLLMKKWSVALGVFFINCISIYPIYSNAEPISLEHLDKTLVGNNLKDCEIKLNKYSGGWCEISHNNSHPSISSVWPKDIDRKTRMRTGPSSVLHAWNSAAFDKKNYKFYFTGGGHADYGGNEVYEFNLVTGDWSRLTDPSALDRLFVAIDYGKRKNKPWRRLCWAPDVNIVPASTHTYDGLVYSELTKTIFLYNMGAANGSCLEDKRDEYKGNKKVINNASLTRGIYEFNPDKLNNHNGLKPLTWRRIYDSEVLKKNKIHNGYPASAELSDGTIVIGSRLRSIIIDPRIIKREILTKFSSQSDWGNGFKIYDKKRHIVWSLHKKVLLAFDADSGLLIKKISATIPHGKSLAIDDSGKLFSWNGIGTISVLDPDANDVWKILQWGGNGPIGGNRRVYGKWVYLNKKDLFVGISSHRTGVWVYKHPRKPKYIEYSNINPQKLVDKAKPGSTVVIPPGIYPNGLFINKSLTLKLKDVSLRGVSNRKGIINLHCNGCRVIIDDFHGNGLHSNCQWGNCAGIKAEGKNFNLTLRRAHIEHTVMGVLTDNRGGELSIYDSIIEKTGLNDRSTSLGHGVYAGNINRLSIKKSNIRRIFGDGHIVKSRAPFTSIEYSILAGSDGRHSRVIDFPCGGNLTVTNSTLQQGDQTDNIDLISVGTEPKSCYGKIIPSNIKITNNWLLFERDKSEDERSANHGDTRLFTLRGPISDMKISDNKIIESTGWLKYDEDDLLPYSGGNNTIFNNKEEAGFKQRDF